MKFDNIDIQLLGANEHGYFYSGQATSGHVIADLSAPISIESIVVVLKGAKWSCFLRCSHFVTGETHTGWVDKQSEVVYDTRIQHWHERFDMTSAYMKGNKRLPPGRHLIPFKFQVKKGSLLHHSQMLQIPLVLPSSVRQNVTGYPCATKYLCCAEFELTETNTFGVVQTQRCERELPLRSWVNVAQREMNVPRQISDQVYITFHTKQIIDFFRRKALVACALQPMPLTHTCGSHEVLTCQVKLYRRA